MKIETKFNIGETVRHIHQTNEDNKGKLEFLILQMVTETCFGGSQTWYNCRPLLCMYDKYDADLSGRKEPMMELIRLAEIELEAIPKL